MSLGANAQEKPIKFGVKAGINLSSVSDIKVSGSGIDATAGEGDGMSFGFHAGGFLNYSFGQFFGIQPELMFSIQGGKQKPTALAQQLGMPNVKASYVFDYINLPVLFEVKPVTNLSILVGPQFGFNVYRSITAAGETLSGKDFIDEGFKPLDVSIAVGLQYAFAQKFHVGARYNLGVTKTYSESESGVSASAWKHNVIQLSFGYAF
jgi:hypothetical protein